MGSYAIESAYFLLLYCMITLALHNIIILIITLKSFNPKTNTGPPQWVSQMRWSPSQPTVFASTDYSGTLRVWDIRATKVPLAKTETHDGKALCVDWVKEGAAGKSEGSLLYSGGSDCVVKVSKFSA